MSKKLPGFQSVAEEAAFWDTHDVSDYLADLEEDAETVFIRPEAGVIEIGRETWLEIARLARRRRTTPARLVQKWLKQSLLRAR